MFHHQHLKMKDAFWTFLKAYCSSVGLDFGVSHLLEQIMKPRPLKIVFNNKKHRKDILDNAYNMKNIPVSNKLSKVIFMITIS
jgi:hypothetical protein